MEGKVCVVTGGEAASAWRRRRRCWTKARGCCSSAGRRRSWPGRPRRSTPGPTSSTASPPTSPTQRRPGSTSTGRSRTGAPSTSSSATPASPGVIKPVTEYPEDVFDAVIATNIRGSFLACKYGLPLMNDGGSIIITSSIMGTRADPGVVRLRHLQARAHRDGPSGGQRSGAAQHPGERLRAGPHRERVPDPDRGAAHRDRRPGRHRVPERHHPAGPAWPDECAGFLRPKGCWRIGPGSDTKARRGSKTPGARPLP